MNEKLNSVIKADKPRMTVLFPSRLTILLNAVKFSATAVGSYVKCGYDSSKCWLRIGVLAICLVLSVLTEDWILSNFAIENFLTE